MFFKNILLCVSVFMFVISLRASVFDYHKVPTNSMEPTINAGGAVFINKLAYGLRLPFSEVYLVRWSEPLAGDIVLLSSPTGEYTNWIKRVLAVQGSFVEVNDGVLSVDGYPLDCLNGRIGLGVCEESHKGVSSGYSVNWSDKIASEYPFTALGVLEDHVFVLGDNRNHTVVLDPVGTKSVLGRVSWSVSPSYSIYFSVAVNVFVAFICLLFIFFLGRLLKRKK